LAVNERQIKLVQLQNIEELTNSWRLLKKNEEFSSKFPIFALLNFIVHNYGNDFNPS
jgi:hypothetical protein